MAAYQIRLKPRAVEKVVSGVRFTTAARKPRRIHGRVQSVLGTVQDLAAPCAELS